MGKALTQEEVEQRIKKNSEGRIILNGDYKGRREPIPLKCLVCGYEWESKSGHAVTNKYKGECIKCKTFKPPVNLTCILCNTPFTLNGGQGGQNRDFCYNCLPEGMSREQRNTFRRKTSIETARKHKEDIGCFICGYNKCSSALEWHHIEDNKEFDPAIIVHRCYSKYLKEIKKCRLLCANCHRELHFYEKIQQNNMET